MCDRPSQLLITRPHGDWKVLQQSYPPFFHIVSRTRTQTTWSRRSPPDGANNDARAMQTLPSSPSPPPPSCRGKLVVAVVVPDSRRNRWWRLHHFGDRSNDFCPRSWSSAPRRLGPRVRYGREELGFRLGPARKASWGWRIFFGRIGDGQVKWDRGLIY